MKIKDLLEFIEENNISEDMEIVLDTFHAVHGAEDFFFKVDDFEIGEKEIFICAE